MSKRLDYNQIAPEGLKSLGSIHGYIAQSSLPATLVDLVYLRVSQDQQLCLLPRRAHA